MNEFEFESNLRRLRPIEPTPELEQRIALALESLPAAAAIPAAGVLRPRRRAWPSWLNSLCWATFGATAGVAAVVLFYPAPVTVAPVAKVPVPAPAPAASSLFEPSESDRQVVSSEEAGTVYDEDNQPSRLVRYTSIEKHTWMNPSTGAEVQVEMPREDVVLVPISYQ